MILFAFVLISILNITSHFSIFTLNNPLFICICSHYHRQGQGNLAVCLGKVLEVYRKFENVSYKFAYRAISCLQVQLNRGYGSRQGFLITLQFSWLVSSLNGLH